MDSVPERKLYKKFLAANVRVRHVCEVGVYLPETSNVLDFIVKERVRTTLVEPDPTSIAAIREYFRDYDNVELLPYAVYDRSGVIEMAQRGASTFVCTLPYSPAQINDDYRLRPEDKFTVECRRFDELDDGTIDLLSIDVEGSEWYVLEHLTSRPVIISVEMRGRGYLNPFHREIRSWMNENGYERWYMDKQDIVYRKRGTFPITRTERFELARMDLHVRFRRFRKRLLKFLRRGAS